MLKSSK